MHSNVYIKAPLVFALGTYAAPSTPESRGVQCFYGTSFPAESTWLNFEQLWNKWTPVFQSHGDTAQEIKTLREAILNYSQQGGFSPALITAIMVQESQGDTTVKCNDNDQSCGVLQVKGGPRQCANGAHPCDDATLRLMIQCGTVGCGAQGTNVKNCIQKYGTNWGAVTRCYNSGSVADMGNLWYIPGGGDAGYTNKIGNILTGIDVSALQGLAC
ncbi:hypothetical protein F5X96DRAFT_663607 [Biscogniauxia mediterranea]|nr:hypothetical protein F5X96DRAFT_663607 [Biscogniauxia mediterranea]